MNRYGADDRPLACSSRSCSGQPDHISGKSVTKLSLTERTSTGTQKRIHLRTSWCTIVASWDAAARARTVRKKCSRPHVLGALGIRRRNQHRLFPRLLISRLQSREVVNTRPERANTPKHVSLTERPCLSDPLSIPMHTKYTREFGSNHRVIALSSELCTAVWRVMERFQAPDLLDYSEIPKDDQTTERRREDDEPRADGYRFSFLNPVWQNLTKPHETYSTF